MPIGAVHKSVPLYWLGTWSADSAEIEPSLPLSFTVLTFEGAMTICLDCSLSFPLMTEGSTCKKCSMLDGQSKVEKAVINVSVH